MTHLHRLASILLQSSTQYINENSVLHYLNAIGHYTHCQPNLHVMLHLNHQTHNITQHNYVHQPSYFTTTLHMTTNNLHVIYSHVSPHSAPTTTLIHLAAPVRSTQKRKRHNRSTNNLPNATRIITLPPPTSALHQQMTLITATHLVLTAPQPWDIPWTISMSYHILCNAYSPPFAFEPYIPSGQQSTVNATHYATTVDLYTPYSTRPRPPLTPHTTHLPVNTP